MKISDVMQAIIKCFLAGLLVIVTFSCNYNSYQYTNDSNTEVPAVVESVDSLVYVDTTRTISICSFNIQFLGHFKKRDNGALTGLLRNFDIVVVQELVAPPVDGTYPDGTGYSADAESKAFVSEMVSKGFVYQLSEEDTGPGDKIHKKTSATEWWITFYKDDIVDYVDSLPSGFLAQDRSNNADYARVPYAFPFRVDGTDTDFVLISVHLPPNKNKAQERKKELKAIGTWVANNSQTENDFIILGDMNIEDAAELADALPTGYISLNDECYRTNTLINDNATGGAKPYDHIMYIPANTSKEIDEDFDVVVLDLVDMMEEHWKGNDPYPGDPYDHNLFKQYYSDHNPIVFRITY